MNLSFEIFPPKKNDEIATVYSTIDELVKLKPSFISVTYGAGGSIRNNKTVELASLIRNKHKTEALAHLTCINSTKEDVSSILTDLKAHGIDKILALRGDITEDKKDDFKHACDLIEFINEHGSFEIYAACYPETHPDAESPEEDIRHLKYKISLGVTNVITQLFFDNDKLYRFLDKAKLDVPVHAGIMPVLSAPSLRRMLAMGNATLPKNLEQIVEKYRGEDLKKAGIQYSIEQIKDLKKNGIEDIHVYVMNKVEVAKEITENI